MPNSHSLKFCAKQPFLMLSKRSELCRLALGKNAKNAAGLVIYDCKDAISGCV